MLRACRYHRQQVQLLFRRLSQCLAHSHSLKHVFLLAEKAVCLVGLPCVDGMSISSAGSVTSDSKQEMMLALNNKQYMYCLPFSFSRLVNFFDISAFICAKLFPSRDSENN